MRYYDTIAEFTREGYDIIVDKSWEDLNPRDLFDDCVTDLDKLVEDINSGTIRSRSTATPEYFRKGTENIAFCSIHSGVGSIGDGVTPDTSLLNLPAVDAVPVRPKEPILLGEDPYHTEMPSFAATSAESGMVRRRTNVLDSLDLGTVEEGIPLKRPKRLKIEDE